MPNETKQEERSEYFAFYVTPTLKRELEQQKDNQALKETIIKNYLASERNWLENELKMIDETTIKYSAKLIGIKEAFAKQQDVYITECEAIADTAYQAFNKLDTITEATEQRIDQASGRLLSLHSQVSKLDFNKFERMLELVKKLSSMTEYEMELLKKILNA